MADTPDGNDAKPPDEREYCQVFGYTDKYRQIASETFCNQTGGYYPRAYNQPAGYSRQCTPAERLLHIYGFAAAERVTRAQLGIGTRGKARDDSGNDKCDWRIHAGVASNLADDDIYAGTNHRAEPVKRQQWQPYNAIKRQIRHGVFSVEKFDT